MKLSNKILFGFFGVIFVYLTAAFAELRLTGIPNVINDSNSKAETVDLSGIRYLVVNDLGETVYVKGSDKLQLEVRSLTGDLLQHLKYQVAGDTLILADFEAGEVSTLRISVLVPTGSLHGISSHSSVVGISKVDLSHLQMSQNAGRVWITESKISNLELNLSNNSFLEVADTEVDSLEASVDSSQANVNSLVGLIRASITNHTRLRLSGLQELQLKKDESSHVIIYE